MQEVVKLCPWCGVEFATHIKTKRFCSSACSEHSARDRKRQAAHPDQQQHDHQADRTGGIPFAKTTG
jgi:hypothetical protein